jgi:hypothetical protein
MQRLVNELRKQLGGFSLDVSFLFHA